MCKQDREAYALAAGLALGLITLGRGRGAAGLADLQIEDRLR
jgi:anaphase-promoting complex subunit 1